MAVSNYLIDKLLNKVLRNTDFTSPATIYLAAYTSDPTPADIGTEIAGASYARQIIAWNAVAGHETENSVLITFPLATTDWAPAGTPITHLGLRDALAAGNLLLYGPTATPVVVNSGDTLQFNAGSLVSLFR